MTDCSDKTAKKREYIPEIVCTVKNCVYNEDERKCYAASIDVSPVTARSEEETNCATFKPKITNDDLR